MHHCTRTLRLAALICVLIGTCLSSPSRAGEDCFNCARMPATYSFSETVQSIQETDPNVYLIFFIGQHLPYSCALSICASVENGDEMWGGAHLEGELGVVNWAYVVEPD